MLCSGAAQIGSTRIDTKGAGRWYAGTVVQPLTVLYIPKPDVVGALWQSFELEPLEVKEQLVATALYKRQKSPLEAGCGKTAHQYNLR
jgi:hypothetical protein